MQLQLVDAGSFAGGFELTAGADIWSGDKIGVGVIDPILRHNQM